MAKGREQPPVVEEVLRRLALAQVQLNLYGLEHPFTVEAVQALTGSMTTFLSSFDRPTCVFGANSMAINEDMFAGSAESRALGQRLQVRGVIALTFLEPPCLEQLIEFLRFLNVEPRTIREQGGPQAYLKVCRVRQITVTERTGITDRGALRDASGSPDDDDCTEESDTLLDAMLMQLGRQGKGKSRKPIDTEKEPLASPAALARLIREGAIAPDGESAIEMVQRLKDSYVDQPQRWDAAVAEIREALVQLHAAKASEVFGARGEGADSSRVSVGDIETKIAEVLTDQLAGSTSVPSPADFRTLFGASPNGLLSSWQKELRPGFVLSSCGRTLSALLMRETGAAEHERLAHSLARLVSHALHSKDLECAVSFLHSLVEEARREDDEEWRRSQATEAMESVGKSNLQRVIESLVKNGSRADREAAGRIIDALPDLAVGLAGYLGMYAGESFDEALRAGIAKSGAAGLSQFEECLKTGSLAAKVSALEGLMGLGSPSALQAVVDLLPGLEEGLAVTAIGRLGKLDGPLPVQACVAALTHDSCDVRCAAVTSLGELRAESAVPEITRFATRRVLLRDLTREKVAGVQALERIGGDKALLGLKRMASRWGIIQRWRYKPVRELARAAIERIEDAQDLRESKAA